MSIKSLLIKHYSLYPKMQIQDMVKLIYQNEFAGGHMIEDGDESLRRLRDELSSLEKIPPDRMMPDHVFENIGNNLCRLNLAAIKQSGISVETVNRFFINTANSHCGNIRSFEEKLDELRQCCREGQLPYPLEELEAYLCSYKEKGYPPVSHSDVYRASYHPAYRIVRSEYGYFYELFCRIDSLMKSRDRVIVAIDGNCASGKTTLASLIGGVYDCNIFHMDDFFLTPELRTKERLNEVGGNVDYLRFKQEVMDGINSGREFQYRVYDCRQMAFKQRSVSVIPKKLNIVEGAYSMHPTLIDNYDLKIFMHVDEKEQASRILKRNGPSMLNRFLNVWIPMENRYFSELNIREKSDLVYGYEVNNRLI
mgnify:CR=1 FL=1